MATPSDPDPTSPTTTSTSASLSPPASPSPPSPSLHLPSCLDTFAGASLAGIPLRSPLLFGDYVADPPLPTPDVPLPKDPPAGLDPLAADLAGPREPFPASNNPTQVAINAEGTHSNQTSVDMDLFLKNQNELMVIRAQLNALKGKERTEFQRRGYVQGRKNKLASVSMPNSHARKVFASLPKPAPTVPLADNGQAGPSRPNIPPRPNVPPPRKAWVAAVCSNLEGKKFQLNYRPPKEIDGELIVEVSEESRTMAHNRWSDYLVGYFIEGRLPFPSVEGMARQMWAAHGLLETLCFNRDFFFFKFPNVSSREKLLDHGPFLFGGRPLILQQWTPQLKLNKICHSKIPLWVKFHHIPLTMWNPTGLGDIASAIGVPLYADQTTEKLQRFDFARICVEVDASKPLLAEIKLRDQSELVVIRVEYQWRPKHCRKCCTFGHTCPDSITSQNPISSANVELSEQRAPSTSGPSTSGPQSDAPTYGPSSVPTTQGPSPAAAAATAAALAAAAAAPLNVSIPASGPSGSAASPHGPLTEADPHIGTEADPHIGTASPPVPISVLKLTNSVSTPSCNNSFSSLNEEDYELDEEDYELEEDSSLHLHHIPVSGPNTRGRNTRNRPVSPLPSKSVEASKSKKPKGGKKHKPPLLRL